MLMKDLPHPNVPNNHTLQFLFAFQNKLLPQKNSLSQAQNTEIKLYCTVPTTYI